MKHLHFMVAAFFVLAVAQAQKISEKDILGKWIPVKVILQGTSVNLETKEVTLSDAMLAETGKSVEDVAEVKAGLIKEFEEYISIFTVVFEPGTITRYENGEAITAPLSIMEQDGRQFLYINNKEKMPVVIENGMLVVSPVAETFDVFKIVMKKQ